MRSYLDFEKPVAELEAKVEELRALQEAGNAVAIGEEITRLEGKRKMSQNRTEGDRKGVVLGLTASDRESDRVVAGVIAI